MVNVHIMATLIHDARRVYTMIMTVYLYKATASCVYVHACACARNEGEEEEEEDGNFVRGVGARRLL